MAVLRRSLCRSSTFVAVAGYGAPCAIPSSPTNRSFLAGILSCCASLSGIATCVSFRCRWATSIIRRVLSPFVQAKRWLIVHPGTRILSGAPLGLIRRLFGLKIRRASRGCRSRQGILSPISRLSGNCRRAWFGVGERLCGFSSRARSRYRCACWIRRVVRNGAAIFLPAPMPGGKSRLNVSRR